MHAVLSFVEMAPALLSMPGVKFLFSERLSQDKLESFLENKDLEAAIMTIPL